jgi:hypothetical protein
VSIDNSYHVIGWFEASIAVKERFIKNIGMIRFNKDIKYDHMFSKDMYVFFAKLFLTYEYRKINYNVAVGSPQEGWYDKFTEIYGGRIVGVKKKHFALENGELVDLKLYEMERDGYINNFNARYPKKFIKYQKVLSLRKEQEAI